MWVQSWFGGPGISRICSWTVGVVRSPRVVACLLFHAASTASAYAWALAVNAGPGAVVVGGASLDVDGSTEPKAPVPPSVGVAAGSAGAQAVAASVAAIKAAANGTR